MADYCEIVIRGYLDGRRATWFEDMTVTNQPTGEAVLSGRVGGEEDWSDLLARVVDLGFPLVSVKRRTCGEPRGES
jgi:hypothetical protein